MDSTQHMQRGKKASSWYLMTSLVLSDETDKVKHSTVREGWVGAMIWLSAYRKSSDSSLVGSWKGFLGKKTWQMNFEELDRKWPMRTMRTGILDTENNICRASQWETSGTIGGVFGVAGNVVHKVEVRLGLVSWMAKNYRDFMRPASWRILYALPKCLYLLKQNTTTQNNWCGGWESIGWTSYKMEIVKKESSLVRLEASCQFYSVGVFQVRNDGHECLSLWQSWQRLEAFWELLKWCSWHKVTNWS